MKPAGKILLFLSGIILGAIAGAIIINQVDLKTTELSGPETKLPVQRGTVLSETSTEKESEDIPAARPEEKSVKPVKQDSQPALKTVRLQLPVEETVVDLISPEDEIIVKKDELLKTTILEIRQLKSDTTVSDSTLAGVSGIHRNTDQSKITVEYWKSPINYRGYKMNAAKLILFGLPDSSDVLLIRADKNIYMVTNNRSYLLSQTNEFLPFETADRPEISNLLNQD